MPNRDKTVRVSSPLPPSSAAAGRPRWRSNPRSARRTLARKPSNADSARFDADGGKQGTPPTVLQAETRTPDGLVVIQLRHGRHAATGPDGGGKSHGRVIRCGCGQ